MGVICPDCEFEVDSLGKIGVCKQCMVRMTQLRYSNKVNGTNKPYIPLKDIKESQPARYRAIVEKRLNSKRGEGIKAPSKDIEVKKVDNDVKTQYYAKVYKDIKEVFENAQITENYLKFNDLDRWVEIFFLLLQEDNFITEAKEAEVQLNHLNNLYSHALESIGWDSIDKVNDISYEIKALKELRRPTKNILDFYYVVDPIISYLKRDSQFIELLEKARITMKLKQETQKDPKFMSLVDIPMARESDFVYGIAENRTRLYDCTVECFNLNGNPNKSLFRAKNGIRAKNEAEAKLKLKNFLSNKFSSVTYKDVDINIKEVNSVDEIEEVD